MGEVNRDIAYRTITAMLDNPDECGIYRTTECYDKLEAILDSKDAEIERLKKRVQLQEAEVRDFISANQGFVEQAEKHKAELHDADQVIRTLVRRIELLKEEVQRRHDEPPTLTEKEIEMGSSDMLD